MLALAGILFVVSLLVSLLLTPAAVRLGRRWGVLDHPGPRKVHRDPVPITGGWAIFATLSAVLWGSLLAALALRGSAVSLLPERAVQFLEAAPELIGRVAPLYAGAAAIFVLGLVDDVRRLTVRVRLVFQLLVAIGLAFLGVRPGLEFLPAWAGGVIGVVWIVGITNAFNFLDGLDGLSAGTALVACASLLAVMTAGNQPDVAFLLAAVGGTLLGFLVFNFHPAKLFLGSSGSLLIGYFMAVTTLITTYFHEPIANWMMPVLAPVLILAIPIYDTTSVVLIRIRHGRAVAGGDQSHFHHRLMKLGYSHRLTVVFIWLVAFAVGINAVMLVRGTLFQSFLVLLQSVVIFSVLVLAERVGARMRELVLERRRPRSEEPSATADRRD